MNAQELCDQYIADISTVLKRLKDSVDAGDLVDVRLIQFDVTSFLANIVSLTEQRCRGDK